MLTLTHDKRGLIDYLADRVQELAHEARAAASVEKVHVLLTEAEELMAIRASILTRHRVAEEAAQLQLPLEVRRAA